MKVLFNNHDIDIISRYNTQWITIKEGKKTLHVYAPYANTVNIVCDVVKKYGKAKNFWGILEGELSKEFEVINYNESTKKRKKNTERKEKFIEVFPNTNGMMVTFIKLIYKKDIVDVILIDKEKNKHIITMKRRKTWSHKKYINTILEKANIKLSHDFRYGWEISV